MKMVACNKSGGWVGHSQQLSQTLVLDRDAALSKSLLSNERHSN